MIPVAPLTPATLLEFRAHLESRGCFAPETLRGKSVLARKLQAELGEIPLDEDAAILAIDRIQGITPRYRRHLYTTARDLIDFLKQPKEIQA